MNVSEALVGESLGFVMIELDWSICRVKPYDIQRVGIAALLKWNDLSVGRIYPGCFALFDEMGCGKTKQVIDAVQFLYEAGELDRVLIVAPASVRSVWFDEELGELTKHGWLDIPHRMTELHQRHRSWTMGTEKPQKLEWMITNYEFIRKPNRLAHIKEYISTRTALVLDESSAVKTHSTDQTKACLALRSLAKRVWLLNGTPIANNPGDMYAQGAIMDPRILGCRTWWHFRARYALMGGYLGKQIVAWRDLEDLQQRFHPYVLRRLTEDSLELPTRHEPIQIQVPLSDRTWRIYKEMRDDMVAWLDTERMSVAAQAGVKAMRLAQITSGFVGGIDELPEGLSIDVEEDEFTSTPLVGDVAEVGREKLEAALQWIDNRMKDYDWDHKIIVWSRFRPEVFRLLSELEKRFPHITTGAIIGGQKKDARRHALRLLDPRTTPRGPVVVVGTPASGSMGLNCTASWTMVYMSNDFNLKTRLQSMARIHRGGQDHECFYFDFVAVGPKGQKTIDHHALKALNAKENLASWTAAKWRQALSEGA